MNPRPHFLRRLLGVVICWAGLSSNAGVSLAVAEPAAPSVAERESLRQQVTELRRELWHLEEMLALTPLEVGEAITGAERRRAEIERALQGLAARVGTRSGIAPDAASDELLRARGELDSLQARIERRAARRSEVGPQLPSTPQHEPGDLEIVATSTHTTCETALELGSTRVRGIVRPEVWFRVRVPKAIRLGISAESLDSKLSVALFERCGVPLGDGASDFERLTKVSVRHEAGEIWVRLRSSGSVGASTFSVELVLAEGQITGRVTKASDGSGVPYVTVRARTISGSSYRSTTTVSNGDYSISLLAPGSYLIGVENTGVLVTERFDDHLCPLNIGCDARTGDPVPVVDSAVTAGVDFKLGPGGEIGGTVRLWPEGTTSSSSLVSVFDASGTLLETARPDAAGRYRIDAVLGSFRLKASAEGRVSELFEEIPCVDGCPVQAGTPVVVNAPGEVREARFTLEALGSVSGRVTTPHGVPIAEASVSVSSGSPSYYSGFATTDSDGRFSIDGLRAATYRATASKYRHETKVWGGTPCSYSGCNYFACDLSSGAPIQVGLGGVVAGVDFELDSGESVTGVVRWLADDSPVPGVVVSARFQGFCTEGWGESTGAASYEVPGLLPGSYEVLTDNESGAIDEVYEDHACDLNGCPSDFTPVPIAQGGPTQGIDFALERGAQIRGTVRDVHGNPIELCLSGAVVIQRVGASGPLSSTCTMGEYAFGPMRAGAYTLHARAIEHISELYDDIPCASPCDMALGTPVEVASGEDRSGVDFVLDSPGLLTGFVRDAGSNLGVAYVSVRAVDAMGQTLGAATTDYQGFFRMVRSTSESAYLIAQGAGFERILHPGIVCPGQLGVECQPANGVGVSVGLNQVLSGLDFTLRRAGLYGRALRAHDSSPVPFVAIDVFRASDRVRVFTALTDGVGTFAAPVSSDEPSSYLVASDNAMGAVDALWQDIPCPNGPAWLGLCDLTLATPIPLREYEVVEGLDFVLSGWPVFKNGFENGSLVGWSARAPN